MKYYHFTGFVLFFFTEIVKKILAGFPDWAEQYYARGIFEVIHYLFRFFSFAFFIPGLFLIPIFYFVFIWWIFKKNNYTNAISWFLNSIAFLYFLFYLVWGFNYYRLPIDDDWQVKAKPFSLNELTSEYRETTEHLLKVRQLLADTAVKVDVSKNKLNEKIQHAVIQKNLKEWLSKHRFPSKQSVTLRSDLPKGIFLHFSTAGMYFPFSGEGNVDPGLHPLQFTAVMAHEMAHGYGFADEGTCNFLAFICHVKDSNAWISYATTLSYWRYLAINIRKISPSLFNQLINEIPGGLKSDLAEMQQYSNRYEDWMPEFQYKMYDAYLKGQGIKEGMLNYNKVIGLVLAYKAANAFILDDSSLPRYPSIK